MAVAGQIILRHIIVIILEATHRISSPTSFLLTTKNNFEGSSAALIEQNDFAKSTLTEKTK